QPRGAHRVSPQGYPGLALKRVERRMDCRIDRKTRVGIAKRKELKPRIWSRQTLARSADSHVTSGGLEDHPDLPLLLLLDRDAIRNERTKGRRGWLERVELGRRDMDGAYVRRRYCLQRIRLHDRSVLVDDGTFTGVSGPQRNLEFVVQPAA